MEQKLTAGMAIKALPLPSRVILPVDQHYGSPARVLVKVGDSVKTGTLVAELSGPVSANIHASISGIVSKIEEMTGVSGYKSLSVEIARKGEDWDESICQSTDYTDLSPQGILHPFQDGHARQTLPGPSPV